MAIRNFDRDMCSGCGNCVAACPMDVFRMDEERRQGGGRLPAGLRRLLGMRVVLS